MDDNLDNLLNDLNPEQKIAVTHVDGPCLVVATPGSGKTKTLTTRCAKLIHDGIHPYNILCLTFTNKAAGEMRDRIKKTIGSSSDQVHIGTFHGVFLKILRMYGEKVGLKPGFSIYDSSDQHELMEKMSRMHGQDLTKYQVNDLIDKVNDVRENARDITKEAKEYVLKDFEIMVDYLRNLDNLQAVDFSGILYKSYLLLTQNPELAKDLSGKFKYISGDEWQDTNVIQYELIKILAQHRNLFVVGDPAQCIFEWRSAKPELMLAFKKDFPDAKEVVLPRNYRSTSGILKTAQTLIRNNPESKDISLISTRGNGPSPHLQICHNPEDETRHIVSSLAKLRANGHKWHDFAILYRTNFLSKNIEIALRQANIPYKVYGGLSFFDRIEIKTTLAYLSVIANPNNTIAFARAIQNPGRGIGAVAIGKIEQYAQDAKINILEACKAHNILKELNRNAKKELIDFTNLIERYVAMATSGESLYTIVNGILHDSGYYRTIQQASLKDETAVNRLSNLQEFLVGISEYMVQNPRDMLSDYLQSIEIWGARTDDKDEPDHVKLLTLHSAKGLEFPVVFIMGVEQGVLPHRMAVGDRGEDGEKEERRLFYVGVTRAKDKLFISYCQNRNTSTNTGIRKLPCSPSQFLVECGLMYDTGHKPR